jgi:TonB family protein
MKKYYTTKQVAKKIGGGYKTFILLALLGSSTLLNSQEPQQHLLQLVQDKQFTLRVPYSSKNITVREDGTCLRNCDRGGWARDASLIVRNLSVSDTVATIDGDRHVVYYDMQGKPKRVAVGPIKISIKLLTPPNEQVVTAAMQRIFIGPSEPIFNGPPPDPALETPQYEIRIGRGEILARDKSAPDWKSVVEIHSALEIGSLADGEKVYLVTRALTGLRGVKLPAPTFPKGKQLQGDAGTVALLITVDSSGSVQGIKVVSADNPGFVEPAVVAVASWQYRPATLNGQLVAFEMSVAVDFRSR